MSVKLTTALIGSLCMMLHLEAENEIEAVDIEQKALYRLIRIKELAGIEAASDVELYGLMDLARTNLIEEKFQKQITKNK